MLKKYSCIVVPMFVASFLAAAGSPHNRSRDEDDEGPRGRACGFWPMGMLWILRPNFRRTDLQVVGIASRRTTGLLNLKKVWPGAGHFLSRLGRVLKKRILSGAGVYHTYDHRRVVEICARYGVP